MISTPKNYGGLAKKYSAYDSAKIAILPIPFDATSTWGKGADKGPAAIIEAAANMELYDIETKSETFRQGIFTAPPIAEKDPAKMVTKTYKAVKKLLADDKFVVSLGGEHSVSLGPIKAHAEKYPNLSILHLDAHSDRRDQYRGTPYSHASIIARAQEYTDKITSVGIRSLDSSELPNLKKDTVFFAEDIHADYNWIDQAVVSLADQVYITIDLDVFDPAYLPSTGTPEPGGLNWYQITKLLRRVAEKKTVVGFDVVELAPNPAEKSSDFLAAKLIYKLLSYIYEKRKN